MEGLALETDPAHGLETTKAHLSGHLAGKNPTGAPAPKTIE